MQQYTHENVRSIPHLLIFSAAMLGLIALPEPYMSVIVYVAVQICIRYLHQKHPDSFIALRAMYLI